MALLPPDSGRADFAAYVTLTSEYIYRGFAMSDGNPAAQAGIDYRHETGWFGGAWASTIDVRTPTSGRDWELDLYAGYHLATETPVSLTVTALRYTYPGASGVHAYDYSELVAAVGWHDLVTLEYAYTDNLYNFDVDSRHLRLSAAIPITADWEISGAAGWSDFSAFGQSRFVHADLGASYLFSRYALDFRYYDNERPDGGFIGTLDAGSKFVVSLTATF